MGREQLPTHEQAIESLYGLLDLVESNEGAIFQYRNGESLRIFNNGDDDEMTVYFEAPEEMYGNYDECFYNSIEAKVGSSGKIIDLRGDKPLARKGRIILMGAVMTVETSLDIEPSTVEIEKL